MDKTPHVPRYDQHPANFSSAGTTIGAFSDAGDSEQRQRNLDAASTADGGSLLSYYSGREMAGLLKKMDGREYNSLNDSYFLPSGEPN